MSDRWFTENWGQLMSGTEELMHDVRHNAAIVKQPRIQQLLERAEIQRDTAEATLRALGEQRQSLLDTLDELQRELAVAGRPLQGEVS